MADENQNNNQDLSIDEILSSIRKIIADDKDDDSKIVVKKTKVEKVTPKPADEDFIELTDVVESVEKKKVQPELVVKKKLTEVLPSQDSFDGIVEKVATPLINKWIDEHLQEIVEYQVAKELEKRFSKKIK